MAIKPIPKAIMIALVVGGIGYAAMNFMPKKAPEVVAPVAEAPIVVAPQVVVPQPAPAPVQAAAPAPAPVVEQAPTTLRNVTSGDAGLSAVLGTNK